MELTLEFAGGLENLFEQKKKHQVSLPKTIVTLEDLLGWLKENMLNNKTDELLTEEEDDLRSGIICFINEIDYALCGFLEYELQASDTISFISTIHGG
ncbi:rurm1 protein [Anaeramoeba flamelloides]|uniref:Ubiquitin-related modifier 1 homolog n=1 Tax=Anaeramoeba flamelloides TaxID=1746091 RepID=A0ABQ8Y5T7_9EUKA|nr:rurm1 protein [Anaeramoeba flamelloides]KAJ6247138.1 rurm1 protein [Anaeramoeba flamelloides]